MYFKTITGNLVAPMTLTSARETRAATLVEWCKRLDDMHKIDVTFSTRRELIVHLLGADHREGNTGAETFDVFRSFTQYLAKEMHLTSLKLVLVGPNLSRKLHLTRFSQEYSEMEKTCQVQVDISYFVGGFEAYFEDKALYCQPDLVVCFNAGIWGYDEWIPAIKLVLNEVRVPLLVTSYNEQEAGDDEDVLDELMPLRWLWRSEKNPRGACTPRTTNNKDGSILKENDYWMCLSGRQQ
ncbi:putative MYND-type domain-containing protein [Phytophthora infestans]|uniref:Putative MYND-type domain-containing protein n=1 Tax=Phytophthora infestans TaxID=4787 RepID=A0A833TED7_PHYIN|nr:putative MYND-type domain-containing protein [Phytophthora infestans]